MSTEEKNQVHQPEEYSASSIQVLEGLEAVRKRPAMYIGDIGVRGLHHLVYEVVDNSIDEALAGYCTDIDVTINEDDSITVRDNGRGIPTDFHEKEGRSALEVVLTVLHAGGKFNKDSYKVSGGLHGVGVSCVNALSTLLTAEVHRQGRIFRQQFSQGTPLAPMEVVGETSEEDHGTIITFKPDDTIFSVTEYDYETLSSRMRELAYLNKGVRLNITDRRNRNEQGEFVHDSFYSTEGLKEFVQFLDASREPLTETPIYIDTEKDGVPVEVAMQYNTSFSENVHSYVNNINTIEGGTHLTGFRRALTRTLKKYAEDSGLLAKLKFEINGDDFREGLTAIVSVKVAEPQFEGQTKTKLGNSEVAGAVDQAISGALTHYLEENPKDARAIVSKADPRPPRPATRRARPASWCSARPYCRARACRASWPTARRATAMTVPKSSSSRATRPGGSAKQGRDRTFSGDHAAAGQDIERRESHGAPDFRERGNPQHLHRTRRDHRHRRRQQGAESGEAALRAGHHHDRCRCRRQPHRHTDADVLLPLHEQPDQERTRLYRDASSLSGQERQEQPLLLDRGGTRGRARGVRSQGRSRTAVQRSGRDESRTAVGNGTMSPKTRILRKVNIESAAEADRIFSMLMGDDVPPRREFIERHAKYANIDI